MYRYAAVKRVILEGGFKSVEPDAAEVALTVGMCRLNQVDP